MLKIPGITQGTLNQYLRDRGLLPEGPHDDRDFLQLIDNFMARGGIYSSIDTEPGYSPAVSMKLMYQGYWLLVGRKIVNGYPTVVIEYQTLCGTYWKLYVNPTHLDAALCYLLGVPEPLHRT